MRYVLEGSVQRSGEKVRIRAQLIDGKTDHHLWAESYDGVLADIFDLQDKITRKIVSALSVKLSVSEQARISDKGTDNVLAYEEFLKGLRHFENHTPEDFLKAIDFYKQAINIDPNFGRAYAAIGLTYQFTTNMSWHRKMGLDHSTVRLLASHYRELAMKKPSPEAFSLAAAIEIHKRNFQKSITFAERAYNYAPNATVSQRWLSWIFAFAGRNEESIELSKKVLRQDPLDQRKYTPMSYIFIGLNHFSLGNLEEAITYMEKGLSLNPEANNFSCFLAASHALLGHDIEAQRALADYKKTLPEWFDPNAIFLYYSWPFKDPVVFDRLMRGLVKADLRTDPKRYFKVRDENKLNGEEIKKLLFDSTFSGYVWDLEFLKWVTHISEDGSIEFDFRGKSSTGKAWIEGDTICLLRKQYFEGLKSCEEVYINPEGDEITKTEYFRVTDYGFFLFSVDK